MFDVAKVKNNIVNWIREFFEKNGRGCNAIIGISGGKDSSVVAALCVEALGKDRVFGVLMPCGWQHDIEYSKDLIEFLGIDCCVSNIFDVVTNINELMPADKRVSEQTVINLPARVRMVVLYAIAQSQNGRVANTSNLSEDWIGYVTRYGDSVGDFSPLAKLTSTEVMGLGVELGLPTHLIEKVPADGLRNETDEDIFGFSYEILDRYIRTGEIEDMNIKVKIDELHEQNKFKLEPMPYFEL